MASPSMQFLTLSRTADERVFLTSQGVRVTPPPEWTCLPPGDAGLTRRVKAAGPAWQVVEKKGRKTFSLGLWAPTENIERARATLTDERSTPGYEKRMQRAAERRASNEREYMASFDVAVRAFLRFSTRFRELEAAMAEAITAHATPVGSGTVARTQRIPLAQRVEAATIAWMRHQTTAYDNMHIPRIKGKRREIRRELAVVSRTLLDLHRIDSPHGMRGCALCMQRIEPELP